MKIPPTQGSFGKVLRINKCPPRLEEELRMRLTFDNPDFEVVKRFSPWASTSVPPTVCLLKDFYGYIEIPRGFIPDVLTPAGAALWNRIVWTDDRVQFNVKFPKPRLTLNSEQSRIATRFVELDQANERPSGTFLFVAPTAVGKTISQASLAAITGQRTLVLCKSNLIRRAWENDLHKMYGFTEDDLGVIQQKSFTLGKHVTLASIATLSRRKHLWDELFAQIGCLIIDEVQIIGADTIQEIVAACPARYIIGMTATETRRDGKSYLIKACMGNVALRIHNTQTETENSLPLSDTRLVRTNFVYKDPNGKPVPRDMLDFKELTDQMIEDHLRNHQIVEEVVADWKAGHSVLVTTSRVEHAKTLHALLTVKKTDARLLTGETNSDAYYTEKLIENVMKRKCRVVVATTQAIKLGANLPPLDRLHTAIPPSNKEDLEQLIGRIRRKHPSKKDAVLVYYHDLCTPYWHSRFKNIFVPTMRKLKVKKWLNLFIA